MSITMRRVMRLGIAIVVIRLVVGQPMPGLAEVACPGRSVAMPVVRWLVDHLDSVTVHRFGWVNNSQVDVEGYPKISTDPAFMQAVLNLTGSYVRWNGYDSPSPFGAFYYPRWGYWYAQFELRSGQAVYYVWMWRSQRYIPSRLLVFTFADMAAGTDSQGQHEGQHDFCMTSVPLWMVQRLERLLP